MSDSLTFAKPVWFALLAAVPFLVALKIMGDSDRNKGIRKMVAEGLRGRLVFGSRPGLAWLVFVLELLGFALIVTALAQPRYGYIERESFAEGRNVIIAIDTSRSMLARDLEPDRLTRSKLAAQDLIAALPGERIGLMAFAGSAYMQAPMTLDHAAVRETIDQLDIYSARTGGTNLGECIRTALETFKENKAKQSALVVFTDGDDLEGTALDAAAEAAEAGVLIVPVGVGSPAGSIIPDTESNYADQFIKDESGQLVKSRLDVGTLETIANLTNGTFINLNSQTMNSAIVRSMLSKLEASASEAKSKRVPRERYQWPLAAGLLLLALGFVSTLFRRARNFQPATAVIALFFLLPASRADAGLAQDALAAYEEGDYSESSKLFKEALTVSKRNARLHFAAGAAHYKNGNYDEALNSFTNSLGSSDVSLREEAHYNIGNTLFRRGEARLQPAQDSEGKPAATPVDEVIAEWENAIAHYEDTLSLNSSHPSAEKNRDIVKQRIEQLKQQQEQQQEQQQQEDQKKEDQDENQEQEQKDEEEKNEEEQEEGEEQEKEDGEQENQDQQKQDEGEQQEGDQQQEQQEGQEGQEGEEKENQSGSEGEEQKDPSSQNQSGEEDENGGHKEKEAPQKQEGSEGDQEEKNAKQMPVPEDEKVNPETGFSKKDARQLLQMLADEQLDIKPLRRRAARRGFTRDW